MEVCRAEHTRTTRPSNRRLISLVPPQLPSQAELSPRAKCLTRTAVPLEASLVAPSTPRRVATPMLAVTWCAGSPDPGPGTDTAQAAASRLGLRPQQQQ